MTAKQKVGPNHGDPCTTGSFMAIGVIVTLMTCMILMIKILNMKRRIVMMPCVNLKPK